MNPCFSSDGTGMYDASQGYYELYAAAAEQTCASRYPLCTNPRTSILASNMVNFYFPIGDRRITEAIMQSAVPYSIYVSFQLSILDADGKVITTSMFAKAPISIMSITRSCESLSAEVSLLGTTKVDLAVGLVGLQSDWDNTMAIYRDVTQATAQQGGLLDRVTNATAPARSIASGLISLVVKGNPGIFSRASASSFYIEV